MERVANLQLCSDDATAVKQALTALKKPSRPSGDGAAQLKQEMQLLAGLFGMDSKAANGLKNVSPAMLNTLGKAFVQSRYGPWLVSEGENGWVTVLCDSFSQENIEEEAERLSAQLPDTVILAVGGSFSTVCLSVWRDGECLACHRQGRELIHARPCTGSPMAFARLLGCGELDIARVFRADVEDQLDALSALLQHDLRLSADSLYPGERKAFTEIPRYR